MSPGAKYDVVVLGAGVIGLSIALELVARGKRVAVVGKDLPSDSDSVGFASPWAGCNWHSFETSAASQTAKWDAATYKKLGKVAELYPDLCQRIPFKDLWSKRVPVDGIWFGDLVGGIREESSTDGRLPGGYAHAHSYHSYILHAPRYTAHLGQQLRDQGVPFVRTRLTSLDQAYNLPQIGPVDLVVNATGLGARSLIGVEDDKVYAARGQTVLVKADQRGGRNCYMACETFMAKDEGGPKPAYIIPRPGPEGHIVLGGTYLQDNHSSLPDLDEGERILRDCFDLDPSLAGSKDGATWRDIQVISHNVGLRPAREGGARVAFERRFLGQGEDQRSGPKVSSGDKGRGVGVVHAYGFGSGGFQGSLGAADYAADLVDEYFSAKTVRGKL